MELTGWASVYRISRCDAGVMHTRCDAGGHLKLRGRESLSAPRAIFPCDCYMLTCVFVCIRATRIVRDWLTYVANVQKLLKYVYTLRLIGSISYPGECDLMVHSRKHIVIFSQMAFFYLRMYITCMHQDTKSARLIAVCKRTFTQSKMTKL